MTIDTFRHRAPMNGNAAKGWSSEHHRIYRLTAARIGRYSPIDRMGR